MFDCSRQGTIPCRLTLVQLEKGEREDEQGQKICRGDNSHSENPYVKEKGEQIKYASLPFHKNGNALQISQGMHNTYIFLQIVRISKIRFWAILAIRMHGTQMLQQAFTDITFKICVWRLDLDTKAYECKILKLTSLLREKNTRADIIMHVTMLPAKRAA